MLNDILTISYSFGDYFKTNPFEFDDVDYYEFYWMFKKVQDEIERKNNEQAGMTDIGTALNSGMM